MRDYYRKIIDSGLFDPDWYRAHYPAVRATEDDPLRNYLDYGRFLGRSPGPLFDGRFYNSTYADRRFYQADALIHYIETGREEGRAYSEAHLDLQIDRAFETWLSTAAASPVLPTDAPKRLISYCIPIMNRLPDLKGTLAVNLRENESHASEIEFLIACLSPRDGTSDWVRTSFPHEIEQGYLRVFDAPPLESWHFGRAKNVFKTQMTGEIYSSLDGDNFVTHEETQSLRDLHGELGPRFVMHHFAGDWGDGTCGRISLPHKLYCAVGYDESFLPRQFDEVDAIITVMRRFPAVPFIAYDGAPSIFEKSKMARQFVEAGLLVNKICRVRRPNKLPALSRRDARYAIQDKKLNAMSRFNFCLSSVKNSPSKIRSFVAEKDFRRARMDLVDAMDPAELEEMILEDKTKRPRLSPNSKAISLFLCCRNDEWILPEFLDHYRHLGVNVFYIVDDHSDTPLEQTVTGEDIHVFSPKVGTFLTSKSLWLTVLMRSRSHKRGWNVTVDADEFVDLPAPLRDFSGLARWCERSGQSYLPGLLLDMLPAFEASNAPSKSWKFDRVAWVEGCPVESYQRHPSIQWGFGNRADLSWRVDARYHAFGTFDSLRKIPFSQHSNSWHLNQGFHTLYGSRGANLGSDIWGRGTILPVCHRKITKMLLRPERLADPSIPQAYHSRTASNIRAVSALGAIEVASRLSRVPTISFADWKMINGISAAPSGWTTRARSVIATKLRRNRSSE